MATTAGQFLEEGFETDITKAFPIRSTSVIAKTTHVPMDINVVPDASLDSIRAVITKAHAQQPFHIVNLGEIHAKFDQWSTLLPRVHPFYALKSNTDALILDSLAALGAGFDCASHSEFSAALRRGTNPSNIVYSNPCKDTHHIRAAKDCGVKMMTFDNEDELVKIQRVFPDAHVILRIAVDDSSSVCQFNAKYGAYSHTHDALLAKVKELGLDLFGVSFHVGSGCSKAEPFAEAVKDAKVVFDKARAMGFSMKVLDLGGGFPGEPTAPVTFPDIAKQINRALETYFPADMETDLRVIAEPGRYFAASCATQVCRIISKRKVAAMEGQEESRMYYINDGAYGAFNCVIYDYAKVTPISVRDELPDEATYKTIVWGPSCDSFDCVVKDTQLPELEVDDWLYFKYMGAYTYCAQSNFNGHANSTPFYTYTYPRTTISDDGSVLTPSALPFGFPLSQKEIVAGTVAQTIAWRASPHY